MTGTHRLRRLRRLLVPSLTLALVSSACTPSGTGSAAAQDHSKPTSVRELTSIDALRESFNEDAGSTRLVLLVSPT